MKIIAYLLLINFQMAKDLYLVIGAKKEQEKKSSGIGTVIGFILFFALVTAFVIAIIYFSKETENLNKPAVTTTEAPVTTAVTTAVKETGRNHRVPCYRGRKGTSAYAGLLQQILQQHS